MIKNKIGITGSIGMGKTTISFMLREMGYPVWIADETIHDLYLVNKEGYLKFKKFYPEMVNEKTVDKIKVFSKLKKDCLFSVFIKNEIYPLLEKDRKKFFKKNKDKLIFFEIPLLFENNLQKKFNYIICVKAPFKIQRKRIMKRENMNEEKFNFFLKRQYPIIKLEKKSDFIILTNAAKENVKKQISRICELIKKEND